MSALSETFKAFEDEGRNLDDDAQWCADKGGLATIGREFVLLALPIKYVVHNDYSPTFYVWWMAGDMGQLKKYILKVQSWGFTKIAWARSRDKKRQIRTYDINQLLKKI